MSTSREAATGPRVSAEIIARALAPPTDAAGRERFVRALLAMYDALRERPGRFHTRGDLVDALADREPDLVDDLPPTWWSSWVVADDERTNALTALPGVELLAGWNYVYDLPNPDPAARYDRERRPGSPEALLAAKDFVSSASFMPEPPKPPAEHE